MGMTLARPSTARTSLPASCPGTAEAGLSLGI